jgi:hypothetical protein
VFGVLIVLGTDNLFPWEFGDAGVVGKEVEEGADLF